MSEFATCFGTQPTVIAAAPGRVNLMGEHTDYNGGFVLPTPIRAQTTVEIRPRDDRRVRAFSSQGEGGVRDYALGSESPGAGWLDYVQGLTHLLAEERFPLRGFDVRIESSVPVGSGLSSSAALSVAVLRGLRQAFALDLDDRQIALLAQRSENRFVGAQVGIMDPMACSLGEPGAALFLDTRSLASESVRLPGGGELVVIHSGVAHQHAAGDYNTRRRECERAAGQLGVAQLRDLSDRDLPRIEALPEPLCRRARHVVTENARVLATVAALRKGDWTEVGKHFAASQQSQRDDYEVSVAEIDLLVELGRQDRDVFGARLTGGGFGGSIVMAVRAGSAATAGARVAEEYARRTGLQPLVLPVA